jgi:hypothetical protein
MNRRDWLKKLTALAAIGIAGDQLEIMEKLNWKRTLFPSAAVDPIFKHNVYVLGFQVTAEMLEDDIYAKQLEHFINYDQTDFEREVLSQIKSDYTPLYGSVPKKLLKKPYKLIDLP